jgi:hypothetical protein
MLKVRRDFPMMIRRFAAPLLALSALMATAAFAQDPGAGAPGRPGRGQGGAGGGRGGFGGGQGGGRFGGMMGMGQEVSLASAPVSALATALKLNDGQKTQIGEIQQALREQMGQQMREMFQGGGGGFGGDPAARQEMMQQIQDKSKAANKKASAAIEMLLTDEQKAAWPDVKKKWDVFQKAGLNIELGEALNLTSEQMKALADYAKNRPQGGPGGGFRPF